MRLLNTEDLSLRDVMGSTPASYAILSHTWNAIELSLQDICEPDFHTKEGFDKIWKTCDKAKGRHEWVWIDSCCIDKTSSAELSEAINSMFQWYENAEVCYVYLEDLVATEATFENLEGCKYFTRGWTLQELLAAPEVIFCNRSWDEVGTKRGLASILSAITGVPLHVLQGSSPLDCTVAQRFSWAANRETTRSEDIAYCLLGLFNVNLAPIYGEGRVKAFTRLQEEILKRFDDQSIFIWSPIHEPRNLGLLASSPSSFCKHEECFEWLDADIRLSQQSFDPYELFEPAGYYPAQLQRSPGGLVMSKAQMLKLSGTQIVTPTLGPQGLQISLLASEQIGVEGRGSETLLLAKKPMTICFDLIVIKGEMWGARLLLQVAFDLILGFNSQDINRRGLVHRMPALLGKKASYSLRSESPSFQRQTFYISQQFPTEQAPRAACFVMEEVIPTTTFVQHCLHEPAPEMPGIGQLPRILKCKGGMLSFYHKCPTSKPAGLSYPFIIAFGIHGLRPVPWCYMKSSSLDPITEAHARNLQLTNYLQLECRSGHFKNRCLRLLPCEHIVSVTVTPDKDQNPSLGFKVMISIGRA